MQAARLVLPQELSLPLLQVSAGGLVSALMGVGNFQTKWIGWPGGDQQWVGGALLFLASVSSPCFPDQEGLAARWD